jgi:hypothetical protein
MLARASRAFSRVPLAQTARAFSASPSIPSRRWLRAAAAAAAVTATGLYITNTSSAAATAASPPSVVLSFGLGLSGQNIQQTDCCSSHSSLVQANWAMATRALLLSPLPSPPHPLCNLNPRPLRLLISPASLLEETRLLQLIRSVRDRSAAYRLSLTGIRSLVHVGTRRQRRQARPG